MIGFVGREHPGGRLAGRAGAVIDRGEHLGAQIGGDGLEGGIPGRVAGPVIVVRSRAARPAQGQATDFLQQRQRLWIAETAVPSRRVKAKLAGIHCSQHLPRIHSQMNHGRRRRGHEFHVIHIKCRLGRAVIAALDAKTPAVRLVRHAEGGQRNRDLLPGIGCQAPQMDKPSDCCHPADPTLHLLAANAAAIDPKTQTGVTGWY